MKIRNHTARRTLIWRKMLLATGLAGVSVVLVVSCTPGGTNSDAGPRPASDAAQGGALSVGLPTPSGPIDPVTMNDIGAVGTALVAAEYLAFPRSDGTLEGRLATEWNSEDASTWTFILRKGVRFHSGQEMTAQDVVATFDRVTDPATGSAGLQSLEGILSPGGTAAVDDYTVEFRLDRPYSEFPFLVSGYAYNTAILPANYNIGDFADGGVGTGPYVLTSFTPGSGAEFVRNENYWAEDAAYLDKVRVQYFSDTNAQILAIQSASVDLVPSVEPAALRTLRGSTNVIQQVADSSSFQSLQMRTDQAPFNDKRVRQALALSINREELISGLMDGKATLGNDQLFAPVFESSVAINDSVVQREQDVARAKQLLAEAGHPNGLAVTLTTARIFESVDHATLIKDMASAAGFDINLDVMSPEAYFASGEDTPWLSAPLALTNWGSRGSASQLLESLVTTDAPYNGARFSNADLDRLIEQYDAETDMGARAAVGEQIASLLNDEVPIVISYFKNQVRVSTSRVGGIPAGPGDFPDYQKIFAASK